MLHTRVTSSRTTMGVFHKSLSYCSVLRVDLYCVKTNLGQCIQYYIHHELRYPFIAEFAGLIEQQSLVYVGHHFLLINSGNSIMPSAAFGGGLTGLAEGTTAERHEY